MTEPFAIHRTMPIDELTAKAIQEHIQSRRLLVNAK
jgi:hypothetical protein